MWVQTDQKRMSFKKNKYKVLKNFVSKEMCFFLTHYFILKRSVAHKFYQDYKDYKGNPLGKPFVHLTGAFADEQIKGGIGPYVSYGDVAFDTLLELLRPHVEKESNNKLIPTYTYARIYTKGNILPKHKDRKSCEISTTLNLGGDSWPIYLKDKKRKTIKVDLKPGDMLLYKGCDLEHWRNPFEGNMCAQVFLHYNPDTKKNRKNIYDERFHLGLPGKNV